MKKTRRNTFARGFMVVTLVMIAILVIAAKAINGDFDELKKLGSKVTNPIEEIKVNVEQEETKKDLDGVIMFMDSSRKFLCYQVIYTDGTFDVALNLTSMVDVLNEQTNDMYVQTVTGAVQKVDTKTKRIEEIKMAHAISEDLF